MTADLAPGTYDVVPGARSLSCRRCRALAAAAAAAAGSRDSSSAPSAPGLLVGAPLFRKLLLYKPLPLLLLRLVQAFQKQPAKFGVVLLPNVLTPLS